MKPKHPPGPPMTLGNMRALGVQRLLGRRPRPRPDKSPDARPSLPPTSHSPPPVAVNTHEAVPNANSILVGKIPDTAATRASVRKG
jgi:hypothetical protein